MPLLGWISPAQRTKEMHDAVADATTRQVRMALPRQTMPKGTKIMLSDFWTKPEVVSDCGGQVFTGFHQLTGSCVGVSDGDAVFTLSAVQRMLSDGATKAFIPWWPTSYGRSRARAGIRGQGEGSIDSVMGDVMHVEGVDDAADIAVYDTADGYTLTKQLELKWSDGNSPLVTARVEHTKRYPVGSVVPLSSVDDIVAGIQNGYPCLNGCNDYCGSAGLNGDNVAMGAYNGHGGHSTTFLGVWEHPNLGTLLNYHNQWPGMTYPQDGSGKPRCSCWMTEKKASELFQRGGDNGETMLLSHLNYVPAQPRVLDWSTI